MKKLVSLLLAGSGLLFLGCAATSGVSKEGVVVKIYKMPSQRTGSLQCNTKDMTMSYLYVGSDSIKGNINTNEKKLIASFAKSALKETSFITPVSNKFDPGYDNKMYPIMMIDVIKLKISYIKQADKITKKAVFIANIDIKTPGSGVSCSTSEPIISEVEYVEPIYKKNFLPSNDRMIKEIVKDVIRRSVVNFVPITDTILRNVDTAEETSAKMLNASNCDMAKDYLLKKLNEKNPSVYYNLGVAYECLAKNIDVKESIKLLKKAKQYYYQAVMLKPSELLYNNAYKEVNNELKILTKTKKRSKEIKEYINNYN